MTCPDCSPVSAPAGHWVCPANPGASPDVPLWQVAALMGKLGASDRHAVAEEILRLLATWVPMAQCTIFSFEGAGRPRTLAVGEDWRFGHKRGGDVSMLEGEAAKRGYRLEAVAPVMCEGERISSSRIRQAIRDGNLEAAARMLGRPYAVSGKVTPGDQLGRTLGFPTANVATGDLQLPPDGVWAVRVCDADGCAWDGVANLGLRPTLGGGTRVLEVHLFGFSGDLYGQNLEVRFEHFLRPEMKFPSLDALRRQIVSDTQAAGRALAVAAPAETRA